MIRFIKKWWLLECLCKEILRHSEKQSNEEVSAGREVLLSSQFFIAGREDLPEYPGLAEKFLWWKGKYKPNKLKRRIKEYNDIFKICVKEGYIEMIETKKGLMPSTATPKADSINGWFGLIEGLLSKYHSVWLIIVSLVTGIIASPFLRNLIG